LYQLVKAHYGVRKYIARCLEEVKHLPYATLQTIFDLAFCYHLGFGISRDIARCQNLLKEYKIPAKNLELEIDQIKKGNRFQQFQESNYRRFSELGHFAASDFSQVYREDLRLNEAESLYRREIETMGNTIGNGHDLVQHLRRQLSFLLSNMGNWNDAEKLQVEMIKIMERGGKEHSATLTYTSDLASTYRDQGRWKEAEELEVKVMETSTRVMGQEHPSTLTSMANLASTYRNQGRWKEAEELDMKVMETRTRVLGQEHLKTVNTNA
jgi:tetratricopeptide (TPR) repeat protein